MTGSANAAQSASINARLTPERLGAATTVSLDFQITAGGSVPAPLSSMQLAYPANLGLATSGLGLASCAPSALELVGVEACPPDSRMGSGGAVVEIPLGPDIVTENVQLALFAAPSSDGYLHVLAYATGRYPIGARVVLSGVLQAGHLSIVVPPIPSLPAASDVVISQMQVTLGGNLTYYEEVRGRSVAYRPPGVGLPASCPRGGFPFAASFAFLDGSHTSARTAVPCPHRH
ncbi:MAG: hypothetical protein ABSG93_12680 [Solirubrobacteraceae bacterium]